jgi:hypothetical protein
MAIPFNSISAYSTFAGNSLIYTKYTITTYISDNHPICNTWIYEYSPSQYTTSVTATPGIIYIGIFSIKTSGDQRELNLIDPIRDLPISIILRRQFLEYLYYLHLG